MRLVDVTGGRTALWFTGQGSGNNETANLQCSVNAASDSNSL